MQKYMIDRKVLRYLYNDKATFLVINLYLQRKKNANNTKSLPRCVTFSLTAFIYNYVHGVRDS